VPEEGITTGEYMTPRGTEPEVMAAHEHDTGAFIGWFGFFDEGDGVAELGYRLARAFWGKGYATEGVRALVAMAFATGFTVVRAETMAVNAGSRRVMEKAGMQYVRTYFGVYSDPVEGADQGDVIYEVRRS
jgi:RimJ/RimL family protein N-acetyltransferase